MNQAGDGHPCNHRIKLCVFLCCMNAEGQETLCYENPRPSSGIHRLVFVLFQQLGRGTVFAPVWRHNFNTREFAELYNLGSPVAAVYYNCQREAGSGGRRMYLS
ncbi:hypothetical protein BHM03_00054014 [Ensete ventricosum]|uniref:Uncharacterized protein n=1 Tax=Ensete ventricosum TaxID=4639 RepID=A0A426X9H3_ENSVE|nr:hypothetical protein B296_00045904 [Ensete ventricosum]RZS21382.1 hypothetical protein BHM03_00054014 [Ensete ventricosum]